jgi:hypothetical protein
MGDSEGPTPLLRTGLRDRLPRGLSHPAGAEAVSRALAGCPRYDELWIAFGPKPLPLHPTPDDTAGFRLAFAVCCNSRPGGWYLSVPAVPSGERAAVRRLLVTTGLPAARGWLCRPRPPTWHEGLRLFQVGYALAPPRACLVESLNRRVVGCSVVLAEAALDGGEAPA